MLVRESFRSTVWGALLIHKLAKRCEINTFGGRHSTLINWPGGFKAAFCIRVDVETVNCLLRGVPALLELFDKYSIKATFFVPMGPDRLGRNFKTKDLLKYLRLDPLKKFGLRNLLYGLLLPPPEMGKHHSPEIRSIEKRGHEVGLHGFGHANWARSIRLLTEEDGKICSSRATKNSHIYSEEGPLHLHLQALWLLNRF